MSNNIFNNTKSSFSNEHTYLRRSHIHNLLEKSIQKPVITVVAGAGYGKTLTVYMFLQEYEAIMTWLQLTVLDNLGVRFWENFTNTLSLRNKKLGSNLEKLGFPETDAKFEIFLSYILEDMSPKKKFVIIYDDFHLLHEKNTIRFVEKFINAGIPNLSFILIARCEPPINTAVLIVKDMISVINEKDLCFSKSEMSRYYETQDIHISPQLISKIYDNTDGWIMAIRLIELSIKKGVAHEEYAIMAMKLNIYKMMENDIYSSLPKETQIFLMKLSLFDSLPMELVDELTSHNKLLIDSILQINSFIRFDTFSNMYCIHHLFLDFLRQQQGILSQGEKMKCYQTAAGWYASNGYVIDAITCYGKAEDYEGLLKIALFWPHASAEEGALVLDIMNRARKEVYEDPMIALLHTRALWFVGKTAASVEELASIIKACEALPQTPENILTLSELYTTVGLWYYYLTDFTNNFDFADYLVRAYNYLKDKNISMKTNYTFQDVGTYVCRIKSEKKEDMDVYTQAVKTMAYYAPLIMTGCMRGMDDLTEAEISYFKNSLKDAEKSAYQALHKAREYNQHAIAIRASFYLVRIYLAQGSYTKIKSVVEQLDLYLEDRNSPIYKTLHDIVTGWFYSRIRQSDKIASWIKNNAKHTNLNLVASGAENLAKVQYYLCEKQYHELLIFLEFQESASDIMSFLFGKISIAVAKSICLYHINQKDKAITALREAYILAEPNSLTMQFIEHGNDMVALTKFALKAESSVIPEHWLQIIQKKSSTYAKRLSQVCLEYKKINRSDTEIQINLTKKELEMLNDIFHGLTRMEIASNYGLSPNYVKNRLQGIYAKLGAENSNDAIRIALLNQLIK